MVVCWWWQSRVDSPDGWRAGGWELKGLEKGTDACVHVCIFGYRLGSPALRRWVVGAGNERDKPSQVKSSVPWVAPRMASGNVDYDETG
jgi:hypothetical protein